MSVQVIFLVILGFGNDSASQAFELLKSHAGQWQGTAGAEGQEGEPAEIVLKVTAAGSAVVETLFPGTEHEIPEQDLQGFLDNGWELAEDSSKNSKEKKK